MTMRKKDYEAIACAINQSQAYGSPARLHTEQASTVANNIADYCATQDPTFKRNRFLADCGVSQS